MTLQVGQTSCSSREPFAVAGRIGVDAVQFRDDRWPFGIRFRAGDDKREGQQHGFGARQGGGGVCSNTVFRARPVLESRRELTRSNSVFAASSLPVLGLLGLGARHPRP